MNTMQQEFDIIVKHLYKQGRPSRNSAGIACKYRNEEGLSCAVGCRIPNSRYNKNMENLNSQSMVVKFGHRLRKELSTYTGFYLHMQRLHDSVHTNPDGTFELNKLESRLKDAAKVFNLTFTVPQQEKGCK